jgi:hypothetical protein
MKRQVKINFIANLILIGFCITTFLYAIIFGRYLQIDKSYLYLAKDKFSDFFLVLEAIQFGDVYNIESVTIKNYFPFGFVIMKIFAGMNFNLAYGIFLMLFISFYCYINYYFLKPKTNLNDWKNLFAFSFLTHPFLYLIDRGNIEGFVFIFLGLFFLAFLRKNLMLAALFLGLASAMKLYPCVFALLFIKDKQYKPVFFSAILTVLLSFISILFFNGSIMENILGLVNELSRFSKAMIGGVSASIFFRHWFYINPNKFLLIFNFSAFLSIIGISWFILKKDLELWESTMLLVSLTILLMPVSFLYKLISITFPLLFFVNSIKYSKYDFFISILFALILIPKQDNIYLYQIDAILLILINLIIICKKLLPSTTK